MAHLKTIGGNFHGRSYKINDALIIGRGINADIQLLLPGISRSHSRIIRKDDKYFIIDLGSKNGTRLNGNLIKEAQLQTGDVIEIGKIKYSFIDPTSLQVSSAKGSGLLNALSKSELANEEIGRTSEFFKFDHFETMSKHELIQRLNIIVSIAQDVSSSLNIDTLIIKLMDRVMDIFQKTDCCTVLLRDDKGQYVPLYQRYASDQKVPFHDVLVSQSVYNKVGSIKNIAIKTSQQTYKQYLMIAPIIFREDLLGLIQLQSKLNEEAFTEEDLATLSAICVQVSTGIATARIHADILQQQSLQQDLEIAQRVQLNFLPSKDPNIQGFNFSSNYIPALQVGGDFYNFIYKKDEIFVSIGDVSGKGVPAALVMAKLTSEIKFYATMNSSPGATFNEINKMFEKECSNDFFATALLLKINTTNGNVVMANAGHHPPLIRRENGQLEEIQGGDTPLGTITEVAYEDISFQLNKGDTLLLYTDGITEATNRQKQEFGLQQLMDTFTNVQQTSQHYIQKVLKQIELHCRGAKQKDDMTIICVQRSADNIKTPTKRKKSTTVTTPKKEYDTDLIRIDQSSELFNVLNQTSENNKRS